MKEKVLIITNMYPSKEHKTFGIFVFKQVEQLRQIGFTVDVLAITSPLTTKINLLKKYITWLLKGLFLLMRGKKYKVVHVHYVFPSGLIGLMFKKIWKQKLIITVHGSDLNKMAKKNASIKRFTKIILSHADHIITVGQELYQDVLTEYKIDPNRVSIISMGVNREIFKPVQNKVEVKKQFQVDDRLKIILFVGNITAEKGVRELVEAYDVIKKRNSQYTLHLIGSQKDEAFVIQIKNLISEKSIKDVFLHDVKPQEEVSKWMAITDVLVLPSYNEGFGLVALEAMACETPVIGSGVGGLKILLEEGAGVIINPIDIDKMAESIIQVVSDEELREKIKLNSQKKVKEHDKKLIINNIKNIYQSE